MTAPTRIKISDGIEIHGEIPAEFESILSANALNFVAKLHRIFESQRQQILIRRMKRQQAIDNGETLHFLAETKNIRDSDWQVGPIPQELQDRRIEITGPVDRKMIINALNSGANVFMADFEDANSPTWQNCIQGQLNLFDAIRRQIDFVDTKKGKKYELNQNIATLMVRPRGWHLVDNHILIDDQPISASLMDFGLYIFHNAKELLARNTGPYFYLPKLENHLEARLWNNVFGFAADELGIVHNTIKATVLIETIHAAFEMDEILYELRDHIVGLNAGRWDYIFSAIKTFRTRKDIIFPDRNQITMSVPFMNAYSNLLVRTCHRRGAHAIGGMAAFIPTPGDREYNQYALDKVSTDKERESDQGFDGSWIAHPGLLDCAVAPFNKKLKGAPHQKDNLRNDVTITADNLLNFHVPDGRITEDGFRTNINVGIRYIESWLQGIGAAAIDNLMEDAATAEISRSQLWQWIHQPNSRLEDGRQIDQNLYMCLADNEMSKIRDKMGVERFERGQFTRARQLFDKVVLDDEFVEFLTLTAYDYLD